MSRDVPLCPDCGGWDFPYHDCTKPTKGTDMEIEWMEPPPVETGRSTGRWDPIAAELRQKPGVWARVLRNVPVSTSSNIKNGKIAAFKEGRWNAVMRAKGLGYAKGRGDLFIVFLGDKDD